VKQLIGLTVIIIIFCLSFSNWRAAVKTVFFLIVTEGALRKWVLPQASDMIYFLKDFVLLGAYIKYYGVGVLKKKIRLTNHPINALIILVAIWCLIQALNPSLGSIVIGIFGLKTYLFYIPMMWMLPALFKSEEELYKFWRSHLLLVIFVGILGIVQFFSPYSSPINAYTPNAAGLEVATFGSGSTGYHARITGTFSYINNYTAYLFVCFGLLVALLSIKQSRTWRLISIVEICLVVVNSMMTGSRTPVIASLLFLIGNIILRAFTDFSKTMRFLRQFSLPVIIVAAVAYVGFRPAIEAFQARASGNSDLSWRIAILFLEPFEFIKYKQVDGFGVGATHPGSSALRAALNLPYGEIIPVGFESEMGRVALEIGPIGFILWYGLRIGLLIALFLVFLKLKRPLLRQLALAAFLIHLSWINGQLVVHHTFAVYYWFLGGFIFLLPWLERKENYLREQQLLQQNVELPNITNSPDG